MPQHSSIPQLAALLLVAACSAPGIHKIQGAAMGTSYTIKYVGQLPPDMVQKRVQAELERFDLLFSTYNERSEISCFNAHRSTEPFALSHEFAVVVRRALELARKTEGAFDPTLLPLLRLHGFGPGAKTPSEPPSEEAIATALQKTGFDKLVLLCGDRLEKKVPALELDLNAMAKGTGVDLVASLLTVLGLEHYMVEIGGEVRCKGTKPGDKRWVLGIENPASKRDGKVLLDETVELRDAAMATSGSYRQFVEQGESRVHHILDPRTGHDVENKVLSVTVIAPTCELADGLATALMVLGPEGAEKVFGRFPSAGLRALFLLQGTDGQIEQRGVRWERKN